MMNRVSAIVLAVGLLAGYAVGGTGVTAQSSPQSVPFAVGDKVTLVYLQVFDNKTPNRVECTVMAIKGGYVKCTPAGNSNFRDSEGERWINLALPMEILKH